MKANRYYRETGKGIVRSLHYLSGYTRIAVHYELITGKTMHYTSTGSP